jgi:ferredoxin
MAWVITSLCRDCRDEACVEVCPVDCIYAYTGEPADRFPNQLFIDPEECIDCGVCEPECPWEAIFGDDQVPAALAADVALNAQISQVSDLRAVPTKEDKAPPTPEQVAANKRKWGLEA